MKSSILSTIRNYIPLEKKGDVYRGYCPFHKGSEPLFYVHPHKQVFHCFGCGEKGDASDFLKKFFSLDTAAVEQIIATQNNEKTYTTFWYRINTNVTKMYQNFLHSNEGTPGYQYLKKERGLGDDTISKFCLGYAPGKDTIYDYIKHINLNCINCDYGLINLDAEKGKHDRFYNRVIFPIFDVSNNVIGFGGRVIGEQKPKYLNTKDNTIFHKRDNLYALNWAVNSHHNGFLLCEGYMDVISLHQAGFDNAVASLGTAFTKEQAKKLACYRDTIYLAYDSDAAGQNACERAISIADEVGLKTRVISLDPFKDPDELIKALGSAGFNQRILTSAGGHMYMINKKANNEEDIKETAANYLIQLK